MPGAGHGPWKMSDITSAPCLHGCADSHQSPQAQPLPSQALLAGDRSPGVGSLAQVAGREAETGPFEKRVVLDKTGLGGRVPRGGAPAVPTSCPYARASVGCPRLALGPEADGEGVGGGMVTCWLIGHSQWGGSSWGSCGTRREA